VRDLVFRNASLNGGSSCAAARHAQSGDATDVALLVWLWGTDHQMARAEVEALTDAAAVPLARGLVGTPACQPESLQRLGYSRAVLRYLGFSGGPAVPFDPNCVVTGSFAVRVHFLEPAASQQAVAARSLATDIGAALWWQLPHPRVDLEHPDTEIHVFVTPDGFRWGRLLFTTDSSAFTARHPNRRPFWRSIAMPPRKARCMVNLSAVGPGGRLLDPFCGTGSIPIEAALLGIRTYASDIDPVIVAGAARNFAALGIRNDVDLRHLDARVWADSPLRFDAIVSDLPYGRSASIKGVDRGELYSTFLDAAAHVLKPGARAVLMLPEGALPPPPPDLVPLARFLEVVHGSLTREVVILQKR